MARDFPEGAPRRQMGWEREDRIFEFDWKPGDRAELAGRYANACYRVPPLVETAAGIAAGVHDEAGLERVREYITGRASSTWLWKGRGALTSRGCGWH